LKCSILQNQTSKADRNRKEKWREREEKETDKESSNEQNAHQVDEYRIHTQTHTIRPTETLHNSKHKTGGRTVTETRYDSQQ